MFGLQIFAILMFILEYCFGFGNMKSRYKKEDIDKATGQVKPEKLGKINV